MKGKHCKYLPPPEVFACEIIDDLATALEQYLMIEADLGGDREPEES